MPKTDDVLKKMLNTAPKPNKSKYKLKAASEQLLESKKWRSHIQIIYLNEDGSVTVYPFSDALNIFNSKEEADKSAMKMGKLIISGKHETIKLPS